MITETTPPYQFWATAGTGRSCDVEFSRAL